MWHIKKHLTRLWISTGLLHISKQLRVPCLAEISSNCIIETELLFMSQNLICLYAHDALNVIHEKYTKRISLCYDTNIKETNTAFLMHWDISVMSYTTHFNVLKRSVFVNGSGRGIYIVSTKYQVQPVSLDAFNFASFVENKTIEAVGNFQSLSHSHIMPSNTTDLEADLEILLQNTTFSFKEEKVQTCDQERLRWQAVFFPLVTQSIDCVPGPQPTPGSPEQLSLLLCHLIQPSGPRSKGPRWSHSSSEILQWPRVLHDCQSLIPSTAQTSLSKGFSHHPEQFRFEIQLSGLERHLEKELLARRGSFCFCSLSLHTPSPYTSVKLPAGHTLQLGQPCADGLANHTAASRQVQGKQRIWPWQLQALTCILGASTCTKTSMWQSQDRPPWWPRVLFVLVLTT